MLNAGKSCTRNATDRTTERPTPPTPRAQDRPTGTHPSDPIGDAALADDALRSPDPCSVSSDELWGVSVSTALVFDTFPDPHSRYLSECLFVLMGLEGSEFVPRSFREPWWRRFSVRSLWKKIF